MLSAQTSTDLRGIYVGGNSITNENPKSLSAALTVPGVDGFLLNIGWADLEPAMGQYQWATLDQWMTQGIAAGKKITVSVSDGANTPAWLFQPPPTGAGAKPLSFSISRKGGLTGVCDPETIAAPWDPAFLAQWDAMVAALAAHLKSAGTYKSVVLLRLTGINRDTDELHLPAETAQSTGLACVSDSVTTWLQAGYRPSLLLAGWDATTSSFQKYFPDKSFTVAIIDSSNPFPPIADDGSVISFKRGSSLSPSQTQPLLALASAKFPGRLVIQNNTLYPGVPAQPETVQFAQTLGTMIAFQTNEDLFTSSGKAAGCGTSFSDMRTCTDTAYLALLETGIYPLEPNDSLRAQYIEIFATDANSFSADVLQAHNMLFGLAAPPPASLISLSNTELEFWNYAAPPSVTAPQTIGVANKGGGILEVSASADQQWVNLAIAANNLTVSVDPTGLSTGAHSSTISVVAPGATNSPQTITVALNVMPSLTPPTPVSTRFIPITPCRIADTRSANGPFGGPSLAGGTVRDLVIPGSACGIPANATAYSVNAAVVPAATLGYLTLFPTGQPQPLVATLNSDGRIKSNAAIIPAGANGAISMFVTDGTDVVLDINGYFVPSTNASALAFYPVTPCRIADTRNATGPLGGPALTAGGMRTFPILSSSCGIPGGAQAFSLNFAAVPKGPLGYLTAWPTGQAQPTVASLNALTGTVTANAVIVPAGAGGNVSVFSTNATDLVIDIDGYFGPAGVGGLSLYTVPPCRVLDSRLPAGTLPFASTRNVNVVDSGCGVPAAAQAFVFSATVVPPAPLGYITMWPQGQPQPTVATLNAVDGALTSNLAIVPSTNGSISVFPSNPTHLVLDLFGYFAP